MSDHLNWGGARNFAGRKPNIMKEYFGYFDMKPRSVYCTASEAEAIKIFLTRKRLLVILQNYEPVDWNKNHWTGSPEEWKKCYDMVRLIQIDLITDEALTEKFERLKDWILEHCEGLD